MIVLTAAAAILFLSALGARDLWNPNEPTYGRAVVEMGERGSWLVPTVNGLVFAEKPILYYWMARAAVLLFGEASEAALRLPLALTAVGTVPLVYLLLLPYAGERRARWAVILYGTTFLVYWSARTIQMDSLVLASTLAAILAVTRVLDHGADARRGFLLAGLAAGIGFAAKGPVAVVCPGIVLAGYAMATGSWRRLRVTPLLLGAVGFLVLASPWYLLLAVRGESDLLHEVLVRQNFTRFVQPWDHQAPWWYYLYYFWIDMAPWAFLVPLAVAARGRDQGERRLDLLAWIWILGIVVFFSMSASKRSAYILPVAPAVAVLASGVWQRWLEEGLGRLRSVAVTSVVGALGGVFLAAAALLHRIPGRYPLLADEARGAAWLVAAGAVAILVGLALPRRRRSVAGAALISMLLVVYLLAGVRFLPATDVYKSTRAFCEQVREVVGPSAPLRSYGGWKWRASYSFYLQRDIPPVESAEALREWWSGPDRRFLIVEEVGFEALQQALGAREPLIKGRVSRHEVALFVNR